MEMNGGFLVTKIKQLGDRIFEKILSEKNIDAFNGAQGRILYVLWQEDGISIRSLSTKCGLAITSLTTMLERMENHGLISRVQSETDNRKQCKGQKPPVKTPPEADFKHTRFTKILLPTNILIYASEPFIFSTFARFFISERPGSSNRLT